MIRILIADDHDVVRKGLRALLEDRTDWEVCGEATNGRQAVEQARELRPDVAVLDVSMPDLNGLEATRQIRKLLPQTEVLILTVHETEQMILEVLKAGARGFVFKSDAGRDLISAVECLSQHKPFLTSKASYMVLGDYLKAETPQDEKRLSRSLLTPREREILQLLAEGKSNKEVGTILGISIKTADTHRTNLMRKLGIHSISELVRYAIRNKFVTP
jgi:DNA-binding NarL/FixJ family response regulator